MHGTSSLVVHGSDPAWCSNWSRYETSRALGKGKYSQVFECVDKKTQARLACKMMKSADQYKYLRELKILSQLQVKPCVSVVGMLVPRCVWIHSERDPRWMQAAVASQEGWRSEGHKGRVAE